MCGVRVGVLHAVQSITQQCQDGQDVLLARGGGQKRSIAEVSSGVPVVPIVVGVSLTLLL